MNLEYKGKYLQKQKGVIQQGEKPEVTEDSKCINFLNAVVNMPLIIQSLNISVLKKNKRIPVEWVKSIMHMLQCSIAYRIVIMFYNRNRRVFHKNIINS